MSPGVTTTIGVPITGTGGIDLQGSGTLMLTADNWYLGWHCHRQQLNVGGRERLKRRQHCW